MDSFSINRVNAFTPKHMPEKKDSESPDKHKPQKNKDKSGETLNEEMGQASNPDHLGSQIDMEA
jgi:hypothetical protein